MQCVRALGRFGSFGEFLGYKSSNWKSGGTEFRCHLALYWENNYG